jgi:hypothetical protein
MQRVRTMCDVEQPRAGVISLKRGAQAEQTGARGGAQGSFPFRVREEAIGAGRATYGAKGRVIDRAAQRENNGGGLLHMEL